MAKSLVVRGLIVVGVASLVGVAAGKGYGASLITWMALAALLGSSMRFVFLIGELNFALPAFFGLGAYAAGVTTTSWGVPFGLALVAGGVVALLASAAFGYVTLRVKGPYFLLIGFAFTEALRILYTRSEWLGGNSGMVGIFPPELLSGRFTPFVVLLAGLMILALALIESSHWGRIFTAIRDNENVVRSVGIPVHRMKVLCFCTSSFAAGVAGALQAFSNNVISPPDFGFLIAAFALAYVKIGGEGGPLGPVIGAIVLTLLASVAQSFGGSEHIFYGAAIVLGVLFVPQGITGFAARWSTRTTRSPVMPGLPEQAP